MKIKVLWESKLKTEGASESCARELDHIANQIRLGYTSGYGWELKE